MIVEPLGTTTGFGRYYFDNLFSFVSFVIPFCNRLHTYTHAYIITYVHT